MPEEIWKKFENIEVSNLGHLKTRNHPNGDYNGSIASYGCKQVAITINGKQKYFSVHRLVGNLFLGLDLNNTKQVINHINNDRTDNRVENIEITTQNDNCQKRSTHNSGRLYGTYLKKDHKRSKPWISQIKDKNNKTIYLGIYATERLAHMIAVAHYIDEYGVPPHCTCNYCS